MLPQPRVPHALNDFNNAASELLDSLIGSPCVLQQVGLECRGLTIVTFVGGPHGLISFSKPGRNALKKALVTKLTTVCQVLVRGFSRGPDTSVRVATSSSLLPSSAFLKIEALFVSY